MTICKQCGANCADDDIFCPYCGSRMEEKPKVVVEDKTFCPKCGKEVDKADDFCRKCGTKLKTNYTDIETRYDYRHNDNHNRYERPTVREDKALQSGVVGFLMVFFLGLIGLVVCLAAGDSKCRSAATTTYFIRLLLIIIVGCTSLI